MTESLGEEPDREDQLEEAARRDGQQPRARRDVGRTEHVQNATREQHRIADQREDGEWARDQVRSKQQDRQDRSADARDQVQDHDRHVVEPLEHRAQRLRRRGINRAIAHAAAYRDEEERSRHEEENLKNEFDHSLTDVSEGQRLAGVLQKGKQQD
jgi:hypothetical protein